MANTEARTQQRRGIKPILTKIVAKYQVTVPPEIRDLYGLEVGDLLEWNFDTVTTRLVLSPKRAELLTPQIEAEMDAIKDERRRVGVPH